MAIKNNKLEQGFIRDENLIKELTNSSDRAKVVLGSAVIEELLERVLKKFFVQDKDKIEKTFEGATGFLGTFSAKIKMAFLLGLISEELQKDLDNLRNIRNKFAHNILGCDFNNQSIKGLCNNFIFAKKAFTTDWEKQPPGTLFIFSIMTLQVALIKKITRTQSLKQKDYEINDLGFEDIDWAYLDGQ